LNYRIIFTAQYNSTNSDAGYPDRQLYRSTWPLG